MEPARALAACRAPALAVAAVAAAAALWAAVAPAPQGGRPAAAAPPAGPGRAVTPEEASLLYQAQQILIRDCLREGGFAWTIQPQNPLPEDREFPYGIDDLNWARAHGYGSDVAAKAEALRQADPNRRYLEALPADRRQAAVQALDGETPDGLSVELPGGGVVHRSDRGCQSSAERALYGDLQAWYRAQRISETLTAVRQQAVADDPRYLAATKDWSACMATAGHRFATPSEARAAQAGAAGSDQGRAREIEVAVAEATCAARSGLSATARTLDHQHGEALAIQFRTTIATKLRMELAAVPKARDVAQRNRD